MRGYSEAGKNAYKASQKKLAAAGAGA